jgi:hypothetical protein
VSSWLHYCISDNSMNQFKTENKKKKSFKMRRTVMHFVPIKATSLSLHACTSRESGTQKLVTFTTVTIAAIEWLADRNLHTLCFV